MIGTKQFKTSISLFNNMKNDSQIEADIEMMLNSFISKKFIEMKTSIKFKKKNIETLKECGKKLFDSADMYSRIFFDLDIRQSKKDLMRLKKSDLCDIIINTFILETQESVKGFMAYKFKQLQDDFEHYKNHGGLG